MVKGPKITGFHQTNCGSGIVHDEVHHAIQRTPEAEHAAKRGAGPKTVFAIGNGCLPHFAEGKYCEVKLSLDGEKGKLSAKGATASDMIGSLLFGLTYTKPDELKPEATLSIFDVPRSWVVDVYGGVWQNEEGTGAAVKTSTVLPGWDAYAKLKDGDRLGLLVRPDKTLKVYLNGNLFGDLDINCDASREELFLVVELYGRVKGVTVNKDARAPEQPIPPGYEDEDDETTSPFSHNNPRQTQHTIAAGHH